MAKPLLHQKTGTLQFLKLGKFILDPEKGKKVAWHQEGVGTRTWAVLVSAPSLCICLVLVSFRRLVGLGEKSICTSCTAHYLGSKGTAPCCSWVLISEAWWKDSN